METQTAYTLVDVKDRLPEWAGNYMTIDHDGESRGMIYGHNIGVPSKEQYLNNLTNNQ